MENNTLHTFDVNEAKKYGLIEAIILNIIREKLELNIEKKQNIIDDRVWVTESIKELEKSFPYFKEHQIRYYIQSLAKQNKVIIANNNKNRHDRTQSYSIIEKRYSNVKP